MSKKQPSFLVQRSQDKQYYFTLVAPNNEVIGTSEMYKRFSGALSGIASVRLNARNDNFEGRESKDGQFYFVLKAHNGKVILTSEMYTTEYARGVGSSAVKHYAEQADIIQRIYSKSQTHKNETIEK